jgi:RNA polymerase sigma-70 factor, ECF subfamily
MVDHPESDRELVERARHDRAAFGLLFDRHYPPIFAYVLRRTGNVAIARDVTAETFLHALQHLGTFRWRNVPFAAWLYRIAANALATQQRDRRTASLEELRLILGYDVVDSADLEAELIAAEDELRRHAAFLRMQRLVAQLPPRYQEVIALRYFEEKTIPEIAAITRKREGTVKSLISRGLQKLRRTYDER